MNAVFDAALKRVLHDLGSHRTMLPDLRIRKIDWPGDSDADAGWLVGHAPGSVRWILTIGDSETAIESEVPAEVVIEIASRVQDAVIDESGLPWPDVPGVGVLDVIVHEGDAWWARRTVPIARVGELAGPSS